MSSSFSIKFSEGRTLLRAAKLVFILWLSMSGAKQLEATRLVPEKKLTDGAKHLEATRLVPEKKLTDGANKVLFPQDHVAVPQLHVQTDGSTLPYRVTVPPSAPNACSYIPRPGNGHCHK